MYDTILCKPTNVITKNWKTMYAFGFPTKILKKKKKACRSNAAINCKIEVLDKLDTIKVICPILFCRLPISYSNLLVEGVIDDLHL